MIIILINVSMHVIYKHEMLLEVVEGVRQSRADQSSGTKQDSELNLCGDPSSRSEYNRRAHEDLLQGLEPAVRSFARRAFQRVLLVSVQHLHK
jgi:hypothetical protein